jgi:hypothetical protein
MINDPVALRLRHERRLGCSRVESFVTNFQDTEFLDGYNHRQVYIYREYFKEDGQNERKKKMVKITFINGKINY